MEEGILGKILEEKDTNRALEASLGILEEFTQLQVSRESGQEEMEFPQRHRKVVDVGTIRPGGPKGQGGEIFGGPEDQQYMPTKNPGTVTVGYWDLGSPWSLPLLDRSLFLHIPFFHSPLPLCCS